MINKVQNTNIPLLNKSTNITKETENTVFKDFYDAAMNLVKQTNELEQVADRKSIEFAMGEIDNIEEVLIAQEKANILLQFTIQVRNKAVESYKEIMRMPL